MIEVLKMSFQGLPEMFLCFSQAAPYSFCFFFTLNLFSSANLSCQVSLRELGLVFASDSSDVFLLAYFRFMHGNQQGQSVSQC